MWTACVRLTEVINITHGIRLKRRVHYVNSGTIDVQETVSVAASLRTGGGFMWFLLLVVVGWDSVWLSAEQQITDYHLKLIIGLLRVTNTDLTCWLRPHLTCQVRVCLPCYWQQPTSDRRGDPPLVPAPLSWANHTPASRWLTHPLHQ